MPQRANHHGREYRCYYSLNGQPCNRLVAIGLLTQDDWCEVRCPKCKRWVTFPKPID